MSRTSSADPRESSAWLQSPLGPLKVTERGGAITALEVGSRGHSGRGQPSDCLLTCLKQLQEYFRGRRREFSVPLRPEGTEFQRRVWRALRNVPYGCTASYKDVAASIGRPKAVRAVGLANGRNPIAIIIPCHRIIGSDGSLVGYGSGLWRKEWLLRLENPAFKFRAKRSTRPGSARGAKG